MTENKRFKIRLADIWELIDYETKTILSVNNRANELIPVCDLLNGLHEERNYFERKKEEFLSKWSIVHTENIQLRQENEQLKRKVDFYKYFQKDERELEKENEYLKKSIKRQQSSNDECAKLIEEQQNENEQLKKELVELHEICAYYENRIKELNGDVE